MHSLSHCASTTCAATAESAFAVVADVSSVGAWALGAWGGEVLGGSTMRGRSLFDGSEVYVRADADAERLVVYFAVGDGPESLVPRIVVRVVPGPILGLDHSRCVLTVLAWRHAEMSDERWQRLTASHEVEVLLLRARIEQHG